MKRFIRRTLREGAEKIRLPVFPFSDANWEFESQILFRISLLLNGFVIVAVTFLDAEINIAWRALNDYTKSYLSFHCTQHNTNSNYAGISK